MFLKLMQNRLETGWARRVACLLVLGLGLSPVIAGADGSLKKLKITTKREGETTRFFVENLEETEVTVSFEVKLENLTPSTPLPFTAVYPPKRVVQAFSLTPIDADAPWKFNYTSRYTIGSVHAVHDNDFVYTLPFALGSAYRVTQGFHGGYSHTGPEEYALDWKMPAGTPIHAARDGLVVKVKEDSDRGGPYREYEAAANYILIRHADGTLANYAHLRAHGSSVQVGQRVRAGELIGFSGNTGFSTGPHLHFSVFKTRVGSERESVPIRFVTEQGAAITLAEGQTYKCSLPGPTAQTVASATSPKDESVWSRLPIFRAAQGGSHKTR